MASDDGVRKRKSARASHGRGKPLSRGRGYGPVLVYDTLRREILDLTMKPGTLLDETELASRFNLSRSPVREALIRLSAEGLVQTLRNRSTVVAPFDVASIPQYLDAIELMYRIATRLAALNRTDAQLEEIRRLQQAHEAAGKRDDVLATILLNRDFHAAIADASGNAIFAAWTRALLDQGQRILGLYIHSVGDRLQKSALGEHVAIVRAIAAKDADAAEKAGQDDGDVIAKRLREWLVSKQTSGISLDPPRGR